MPKVKTEAEEADWYTSPAGRRQTTRQFQQAIRKGVITTESRDLEEVNRLVKQNPGRAIVVKNGLNIKRTDPAVLQKLMEEARASMTKPVSLRLAIGDLEAAKRLAEKKGVGYQTVLKQIIEKGLRNAG